MDELPIGVGTFSRGHIAAKVIDQFGDERIVHRVKGRRLSVKRAGNTPAHALNRAVAVALGRRIRQAREAAGMSLADLCIRAGLASATPKQRMYEIERGHRREGMRLGTLYAIAIALELSPADLLPSPNEVTVAAGVRMGAAAETLKVAA